MLRGALLTLTVASLAPQKLNKRKSLNYQLFEELNKRKCGASLYYFSNLGERDNVFYLAREEKR